MKFRLFTLITLLFFTAAIFAGEQLIGRWLITEGSGTTAYCAPQSYRAMNAELVGTENWTTDENGTWFHFTGGQTFLAPYDTLVEPDNTFPIDFTKSFRVTFEFWAGGNSGILSNDTVGWGGGAWNIAKSDGKLIMQQHSSGVAFGSIYIGACDKDGDSVVGDDWYSVEVSYTASTGKVGFKIDGVEDTGVTYYGGGSSMTLSNNAQRPNLVIGWSSLDYQKMIGGIRNIRIYQNFSKPTTPVPYNGQTAVVPGSITLDWDDSYGNYTAGYNVYISTEQDAVINRAVTPVAVTTSSANVTVDSDSVYYWAVDGSASDPNNTIGDVWSFQTQGVKPYNLIPADDATGVSIFGRLQWTADSSVDGFKVYISDNPASLDSVQPIETASTSINFNNSALELHRWYYWKVAAVIEGQEFDSVVSSFQTTGDEYIDTFSYGSNAAIQAAWVQQAGSGYNIAWLSRPAAPYGNPALGNIPYGPTASSFIRTFDTPRDFTTAVNLTIRVFHEANSQANSAPLTVSLLDAQGGLIYEDTYTPGDVLSDDGTFKLKVWYRWVMPLADVAGMNAVAAIKLTVPSMAAAQWLFIDDLTITVPQCDGAMFGDAYGDCQIDLRDYSVIAANWLACNRIPVDSCEDYFYEVFTDMD